MEAIGFDVTASADRRGNGAARSYGRERHPSDRPHERLHLYGGQARYTVDAPDSGARRDRRAPACASSDYGTPFYEIFRRHNNDFYKIDPRLFSPAEVWLTSAASGRTFHGGQLAPDVLRASLLGE